MPTFETTLRDVLISWLNVGPFRDDDDIAREQTRFAATLSLDDLPALVEASLWLVRDGDTSAPGVLYEVFERLIPHHRDALTDELLRRLEGDSLEEEGDSLEDDALITVLELLGTLGSPRAAPTLFRLSGDGGLPVAARVSAVDALGELDSAEADHWLLVLRSLGRHPRDVQRAIERAIINRRAKQASGR